MRRYSAGSRLDMFVLLAGLALCIIVEAARGSAEAVPYRLDVGKSELNDLSKRIAQTRFTPATPAFATKRDDWSQGMPLEYLKELLTYWKDQFLPHWKSQHERIMNLYPMFLKDVTYTEPTYPLDTNIDRFYLKKIRSLISGLMKRSDENRKASVERTDNEDNDADDDDTEGDNAVAKKRGSLEKTTLKVHYIHALSTRKDATPLIFLHGWPGSYLECLKVLPMLTNPTNASAPAFHVVCPSIPGYGFGESPSKRGFNAKSSAALFMALMRDLGYPRFTIQGGDWGSVTGIYMARMAPSRVTLLHINMIPFPPPLTHGVWPALRTIAQVMVPDVFMPLDDYPGIRADIADVVKHSGYFHQQATFPTTLGHGLSDSPAGLASWIVDKFYRWSDVKNVTQFDEHFSKDELLRNVMVYWLANTATSGLRYYYEFLHSDNIFTSETPYYVTVPTAVAVFPGEVIKMPRSWVEDWLNVVRYTRMSTGGHFASMEEPISLVSDLQAAYIDQERADRAKEMELAAATAAASKVMMKEQPIHEHKVQQGAPTAAPSPAAPATTAAPSTPAAAHPESEAHPHTHPLPHDQGHDHDHDHSHGESSQAHPHDHSHGDSHGHDHSHPRLDEVAEAQEAAARLVEQGGGKKDEL